MFKISYLKLINSMNITDLNTPTFLSLQFHSFHCKKTMSVINLNMLFIFNNTYKVNFNSVSQNITTILKVCIVHALNKSKRRVTKDKIGWKMITSTGLSFVRRKMGLQDLLSHFSLRYFPCLRFSLPTKFVGSATYLVVTMQFKWLLI